MIHNNTTTTTQVTTETLKQGVDVPHDNLGIRDETAEIETCS